MPPIRNSSTKERKIQTGPLCEENKKKSESKKTSNNPKRLNYSYDYFKEWDKYDVDTELKRLEEEEKRLEEERSKCPKTADPGDDVHSDKTYQIESMTPLEKRVAAQREKEKGNECMKCGEFNAAVAYYSKSLELIPGDHLVLGNRSQAYLNIHCYLQAEIDCDKALSIEPNYTKARYRRAVARKEQGNWEGSLEDLDRVLIENTSHSHAEKLRAECLKKLEAKRKEEEEKKRAEEERQRYEKAPRHKIAIHEVDGDDDDDDDDDGMDKKALDHAREAVRLKKEAEEKLLRKEAAQRKKVEGNEAFKRKDLAAAAALYSEAIRLYPTDDSELYVALSNRALVYLQQDEFAAAEADCDRAITINPKWAKAYHRRGLAKAALNRRGEALNDLETALKLEPDSKQTLEEIRKLRHTQRTESPKREFVFPKSNEAGGSRPKIVELSSENFQPASLSSSKIEILEDDDEEFPPSKPDDFMRAAAKRIEIIEDEDSESDAPAVSENSKMHEFSKLNRIQVVEDEDSEEEEVWSEDATKREMVNDCQNTKDAVSSDADPALLAALNRQDEEGEILDDDEPYVDGSQSAASLAAEMTRVNIQEDSDDDDDDDDAVVRAFVDDGHNGAIGIRPTSAQDCCERGENSKDELEPDLNENQTAAALGDALSAAPELWGVVEGRDHGAVLSARAAKEEGDQLMKQGLFEAAAERYSHAVDLLGDSDAVAQERRVCFSNRAGCRLQLRDYGSVIADCGEVLAVDGRDVKALVRRGLAYEGLEKLAKASADVRAALSVEYSRAGAGGRLSNFGLMARQCLERCHRACPEVCPLTIPVTDPTPSRAPGDCMDAQEQAGQRAESVSEAPGLSGPNVEPRPDGEAASEDAHTGQAPKQTGDAQEQAAGAARAPATAAGDTAEPGARASGSAPPTLESPAVRGRRAEAEVLKTRGNEAFEAGRSALSC